MAENIQRSKGRAPGYRFDRGGTPTEFGPFIGVVVNNIDPTRAGRVQVWIQQFGATTADGSPDFDAKDTWRTVSYIPPFYGSTPKLPGTTQGAGTFTSNQQSYGMWFTPPDLYTQVICFFVGGDPNQGYYLGCVPDPGINHMIPAIGAASPYKADPAQEPYFTDSPRVPVTEINDDNISLAENPRFFDAIKPVHVYVAAVMLQQGLINDPLRGPIGSSSQRESPSSVFGISTPGRAIYQGGLAEADIRQRVESGTLRPEQVEVIARRGGHSLVMDDGDLTGQDQLVRIRTAKGHQITMSDSGDCFYITHANGQTWLEFGSEGTVDVFSTNSVNIRSKGEINLHADKNININAGEKINIKATEIRATAVDLLEMVSTQKMNIFAQSFLSVVSDGTIALKSSSAGGWDGGGSLAFKGGTIDLNGPAPPSPATAEPLKDNKLPDTKFVANQGWEVEEEKIDTVVTRAPTHEPYPYHNRGVDVVTSLGDEGVAEVAATVPSDVTIRRRS